jgi:hypothetical protein
MSLEVIRVLTVSWHIVGVRRKANERSRLSSLLGWSSLHDRRLGLVSGTISPQIRVR